MPKSAWTEKDQIDNFLKERRLMRSLEKIVGGRLYEGRSSRIRRILKDGGEVDELRAIFGHMLGAFGVQILKDDLDNLHSIREEDGTSETVDPQD
ncbi:hypothetical protein Tco_0900607 [Tanacetum coccineum]